MTQCMPGRRPSGPNGSLRNCVLRAATSRLFNQTGLCRYGLAFGVRTTGLGATSWAPDPELCEDVVSGMGGTKAVG